VRSRAIGTILDEEGPFFVTQGSAAVLEGGPGDSNVATMEVWLPAAPQAGEQVTLTVQTGDESATAGSDYVAVPPTPLTFGPGEAVKQVPVTIIGDSAAESDETFVTHISGASMNANIADSEVPGLIVDDDPPDGSADVIWVYASNDWVVEGDSGTTDAVVDVYLSRAPGPGEEVRVTVYTAGEAATSDVDFQSLPNTVLTFGPGEISKPVVVPVYGDTEPERLEQFLVWVTSPVGALISDKRGRVFINSEEGLSS
jgi:hypothetical protein